MSYETQASGILDHAFLQNLYEHGKGNYFLSGGVLTSAGTDLETDYTAIEAVVNSTRISAGASNVTHSAGDATNPRMDIVEMNSSGTVSIVEGTPTAESSTQTRPPLGTLTADSLIMAVVYVPANASTILDANIFDRRVLTPTSWIIPATTVTMENQLDVEGYMVVGDGAALSAHHTVLVDRDFDATTAASQIRTSGTITATSGTSSLSSVLITPGGLVINSGNVHTTVASLVIDEPAITETSGSVTNASTVYISTAPTEGANNYGLFVDAGLCRFDDGLETEGDIDLADGGTVAQGSGSGKATGVTLNTHSGQITMDGAQLNAGVEVTFTVTNSKVAATDIIIVNHASGGTSGAYQVGIGAVASGSFAITLSNASGGNLTEAPVINFGVFGGSAT